MSELEWTKKFIEVGMDFQVGKLTIDKAIDLTLLNLENYRKEHETKKGEGK